MPELDQPIYECTTEDKISFLKDPKNHSGLAKHISAIETHFSWVFIGEEFVYKMKKPIVQPLFDFRTLDARKHNCEEEFQLNKRIAKDIYLGVIPLTIEEDGKLIMDGKGAPVEWLIKMRRIPEINMLDHAIKNNDVTITDLNRVISKLTNFYKSVIPETENASSRFQFIKNRIGEIQEELLGLPFTVPQSTIKAHIKALQGYLSKNKFWFVNRIKDGYYREIHGDLRPEHVCLRPQPTFIDCLEFFRPFRIMDMADEVSYLSLECEILGRFDLAYAIITRYKIAMSDPIEDHHIHFFKAYKAMIRARMAIFHLVEPQYANDEKYIIQFHNYLKASGRHIKGINSSLEISFGSVDRAI